MENQTNNVRKQGEMEESSIDIRELFFMVINNWWIFLISMFVCGAAAFLFAKMQTPTYEQSAMILVRDEKAGGASAFEGSMVFEDLGMFNKGLVLENEIYILQSSPLMSNVVNRLNLQVTYRTNGVFKKKDLYGENPIHLKMLNKEGKPNELKMEMDVTALDGENYAYRYKISDADEKVEGEAMFGEVVELDNENSFAIETTGFFDDEYIGKEIKVTVTPTYLRAKALLKNLTVSRPDKITGILNLTMKDSNPLRAQRILDTLIEVYNDDAIADKNKIAQNTEDFIVNRIGLISGELEDVDARLATLMKESDITDAAVTANVAVTAGVRYSEQVLEVETELNMVQYMRQHLNDPTKQQDLIPTNVGITDAGVQSLINNYNTQKLEYDKIVQSSGDNNPTLKSLKKSLASTREAVVRSVDNLLETLKIKKANLLKQEKSSQNKISSMPEKQKRMTEVTRQQQIKHELYMYLLNKREENALTLAVTESNAKVIESANGVNIPIAPRTMLFVLVGLVLGFGIPFAYVFLMGFFNTKVRSKADIEK
ncbi:MAG: hypothetical protein IKY43_05790 [Bacteroidales bacterium]|nr:hypothetical protein [Bacteroidales bacterium]